MSFFSKVTDFLTGGLGSKIVDKVMDQFPDRLSESEKLEMKAAVVAATREHELKLLELAREQDEYYATRIKEMEGTAKDLMQFGFLGKLIVFLRGAQRPIWGYFVIYMDFMVFSGCWSLTEFADEFGNELVRNNMDSAFWLINFLVLGFLFGERAMKNVLPLVKDMQANKA